MQPAAEKRVILASADGGLLQSLGTSLAGMRWHVREAAGGAGQDQSRREREKPKPP